MRKRDTEREREREREKERKGERERASEREIHWYCIQTHLFKRNVFSFSLCKNKGDGFGGLQCLTLPSLEHCQIATSEMLN